MQLFANMKFLFHVTHGAVWKEVPHEENLCCAKQLAQVYGGIAEEVMLTLRDNRGEADPPYATRIFEEKAVAIETSLEALAQWAADNDGVVHVLACEHWQDSTVGTLTHRIFISDATGEQEPNGRGYAWGS